MRAHDLIKLLARKHEGDIFVTECKTGPSYGRVCRRFDAWAMPKSWARMQFIGYEIKVSKSDFNKDDKWIEYLEFCSDFYFVTPWQLVSAEETPDKAGLIWASKSGVRLFTKKKSPHRDIMIPDMLMMYILMQYGPTGANGKRHEFHTNDKAYWEKWLAQKKQDISFGYKVGKRIREVITEEIEKVKSRNAWLENENKELIRLKEVAEKLGIRLDSWTKYDNKLKAIMTATKFIEDNIVFDRLENLSKSINNLIDTVTGYKSEDE